MKKCIAVLVMMSLMVGLLLSGCGNASSTTTEKAAETKAQETAAPKAEETKTEKKDITIGAIVMDTKHEWFAEVIKGMQQAEKDLGVKVKIASSDSDVSKEADLIDQFIAQKVNGISVSCLDFKASVPAFDRAWDAKIPVISWNTKVDSPNMKYFVGVDNYTLGANTGDYAVKYIKEKMGGKAKVSILGTSKYTVGVERVKGFTEKLKAAGIEVVANQDAEFKEGGLSVTETLLQAHPDTQLIWCWNQGSLLGALASLKNAKRNDIVLMGTDMSIDLAKEMVQQDTFLKAVTTQQPFQLGYQSIKNAVDVIKGGTPKAEELIPVITYTVDDKAACQKYLDDRKDLIK